MSDEMLRLRTYTPEPGLRAFHASDAFVRGIRGPFGCLPGDAEYLTEDGWRVMSDWTPGTRIAQWDMETGGVEYREPEEHVVLPATGWFCWESRSASIRLKMSEEQRLPVLHRTYLFDGSVSWTPKTESVGELSEIKGMKRLYSCYTLPDREPSRRLDPDLIRYAVAVNADGTLPPDSPKAVVFGFTKARKVERMIGLLDRLGLEYTRHEYFHKKPYTVIRVTDSPYLQKSFTGSFWWGMGGSELNTVLSELCLWDGCFKGPRRSAGVFTTTREEDIGFLQHAAAASGVRSTVHTERGASRHSLLWVLTLIYPDSQKHGLWLRKGSMTAQYTPPQPGELKYCFRTHTGYFIIRQGGQVLCVGNSGKSVSCCVEIFTRALEQPPDRDGRRRSRWVVIRNSYPELLSTTLKTWTEWYPERLKGGVPFCPVRRTPPITAHISDFELTDGTRLDLEVLFMALDREEVTGKLRSLELSGAWLNEASELPLAVLEQVTGRVGRFPPAADMLPGTPSGWSGVIMDTNPPHTRHWWYELAEIRKPDGYEFFRQPPAVIMKEEKTLVNGEELLNTRVVINDGTHGFPPADNLTHLNNGDGAGYYLRQASGKDPEYIRVFLMGEYGRICTGQPVYPEYRDVRHAAKAGLDPLRGVPLVVGLDYGLNHSAVFTQLSPSGRLIVLGEIVTENCGSRRFAREFLRPTLKNARYKNIPVVLIGDPAGSGRSQTDEMSCMQIFAEEGFNVAPAPTNSFPQRRDAVAYFLSLLTDGEPGFVLDPGCEILRDGFNGGYHFRKVAVSGYDSRYAQTPDKNIASHPHDALQYAALYHRGSAGGLTPVDPWSKEFGAAEESVSPGHARRIRQVSMAPWS